MRRFLFSFLLIFAVAFPAFAQPVIFEHYDAEDCVFKVPRPKSNSPIPNFFIPSLPSTTSPSRSGQIAIKIRGKWTIEASSIGIGSDRIDVFCIALNDVTRPEGLAYPIDSRMTRADIEGATILKPNADNTAWLFFHADKEDHYDRELAIQAAIVGAFQRTLDDANLDIIRHRKNAAVQNAKILTYGRLIEFRNDWVGYALIAEQRKHIGHHVQDTTYVHECVIDSFNDAIKEWKKNKADAWTPISYHVETVAKRRITTLHDYDEPWNHPTRRVIDNLKKKAEAEAAESEGE